jgi:hypothetical protein
MFQTALKSILILSLTVACSSGLFGQQSDLSRHVIALSETIISDKVQYPIGSAQITEVDSLFKHALRECSNNVSESLLALTFACLPFQTFTVRIPVVKLRWGFSVYSADSITFLRKNEFLLNNVYFDSPKNKFGDKDKLAHFYGAAFLGYLTGSTKIPNFIGCLVEAFEETFKVDSYVDMRDVRTNNLGGLFGRRLRKDPNVNPSMYFSFYNVTNMIR